MNLISPREKLISIRPPHWIYLLQGIFWVVLLTIIGLIVDYLLYYHAGSRISPLTSWFEVDFWFVRLDEDTTLIPFFFFLTGLAVFWPYFLTYISHVIVLTDQRIIHKKGLIFVHVDQVDLEDIRAEHVDHGILGWFIGYGTIRLNCRFIEDVFLPAIERPYRLIKALHNTRFKDSSIEYHEDMFKSDLNLIDQEQQKASRKGKFKDLKHRFKSSLGKSSHKETGKGNILKR